MKLSIIATGLFRNFFQNNIFSKLIERCKSHYDFIYIFLVINEELDSNIQLKLNNIFTVLEMQNNYKIIGFKPYAKSHVDNIMIKQQTEKYNKIRDDYMLNNHSAAKHFLADPNMNTIYSKSGGNIEDENVAASIEEMKWLELATIPAYQLKIGLEHLLQYENEHDMKFDVIMKTRLDLEKYPDDFFPYIPDVNESILSKITFNRENIKNVIVNKMCEIGASGLEDFIDFLKTKKIISPDVWTTELPYNLGGMYLNNHRALENINNGSNEILYAINDLIFFAKRDVFIKLRDFYDEFALLDTDLNITHYYAPEAQLLIYCFHHGINPLMYWAQNHYEYHWI